MARFDAFSPDFEHPFINSSPDYGSRNRSYGSYAVGDITTTPASFRDRSKRVKALDNERNQLIEDLLYQLELTEKLLEQCRLDLARETNYNREVQLLESSMQDQLRHVKALVERDPYVLILIDGDVTVFSNDFIRRGEKGGKEAADNLFQATSAYAADRLPHLASPKILMRLYANTKQLGESLLRAGVVDKLALFDDFMRGFNGAHTSLEMVDSGINKDRTAEKICEAFKTNLYNCHCHQVVLGCSNTSDYTQILEEVIADPQLVDRVTLLESTPFDGELSRLKKEFKTTTFKDVFRPTKLVLPGVVKPPKGLLNTVTATLPALTRVESNGTAATGSAPITPALTWASLTAAPFVPATHKVPPSLNRSQESPPTVSLSTPGIDRNRQGQRIDKMDTTVPREEINRIKKLKLCNVYFLQGADACINASCGHDHSYPLSKGEKKVLAEVARMTPCFYQTDCEDASCIYGHRCPQSKPNEKDCWYKEQCRFWGWGHGIDTRVVKITKV